MSLFDDRAVVEAAGRAFAAQSTTGRHGDHHYIRLVTDRMPPALDAALAALPREELIEKAALTLCDQGIRARDGSEATWEQAVLVAIGLIPEHAEATDKVPFGMAGPCRNPGYRESGGEVPTPLTPGHNTATEDSP